jgi:hypothetical protein
MGGFVGSIFDLASGDPTSGEQQGLQGLSGFENNAGEGAVNAGLGFNNAILSGNPEAIAQVEAPEIRAGQQQVQQTAEQNALFGNRGGGTNSATNSAQSNERGNIINLTGQLQQGAAQSDLNAGQNLLGQGAGNLVSQAGLASANQQRETNDVSGIAKDAGSIATGLFDTAGASTLTGADPYETLYNAQHPDTGSMSTESPDLGYI